ncbi:MAG: preprotein translocase subunit YajC [Kiritimatiellae bacterium]|jgi:preprotein translocase subunit YajC|nr:preprotein translocase subunit YajC [Kiritimatiellia bacterium]
MNNCLMLCDAAAAPAANAQPAGGGMGMMVPMLLILGIFYFMMIRPQQRKEKERRKMIEELRAGAKIIFAGGLMGTIQEATEKTFKVEICPGTTVEIARACVTGVVNEGEAAK